MIHVTFKSYKMGKKSFINQSAKNVKSGFITQNLFAFDRFLYNKAFPVSLVVVNKLYTYTYFDILQYLKYSDTEVNIKLFI